ncbi:hypothetical protein [Clostridium estertheticum]|uniref:hypothetical protein n=1 Tax=Clostridium estertheticum TaxID=238834 RepID=UPI001C0DB67B|nr:hypothetical protein [Clostridium estertheticum]MBU3186612.1 hypothetical protein [Clostridium estertheticum]
MTTDENIMAILTGQGVDYEQINLTNSIYKIGTYKISKLFKNSTTQEIEQWANNILTVLNNNKDIYYNCECDFRITNDGNEKWNTGNLYVWIK